MGNLEDDTNDDDDDGAVDDVQIFLLRLAVL